MEEYSPAIPCDQLINSWTDLKEEERQAYYDLIYEPMPVCPNITHFELQEVVSKKND